MFNRMKRLSLAATILAVVLIGLFWSGEIFPGVRSGLVVRF